MLGDGESRRNRKPDGDYEVGYGRPPKHSRFREGQSGNPAGAKPGRRNLAKLVIEAPDETVFVTEGGRRRKVSRREIIARQLVNRSAGADLKAIAMLLALIQQLEAAPGPSVARTATADDQAVLKGLRERFFGQEDDDEAQS